MLFDNFNMVTFIMPILLILILYFCSGNSSAQLIIYFMEVFVLNYEGLDPNDTGILAMYANRYAVQEALDYANSLHKYYKLWIEVSFVSDKFFKSDFD